MLSPVQDPEASQDESDASKGVDKQVTSTPVYYKNTQPEWQARGSGDDVRASCDMLRTVT